jgi:hypothetical protein
MRCCGIQVNPESGAGYDKLPFDRETRAMIRAVHRGAGDPRFQMRYNPDGPTHHDRRSSAVRTHAESRFHRPDDLVRERLRLRVSLLQRLTG